MRDYYFYITKADGIVRILKLGYRKFRVFAFKEMREDWYVGKVFRLIGNARPFGKGEIKLYKRRL